MSWQASSLSNYSASGSSEFGENAEEDGISTIEYSTKDALILLIDCHATMHEPADLGSSSSSSSSAAPSATASSSASASASVSVSLGDDEDEDGDVSMSSAYGSSSSSSSAAAAAAAAATRFQNTLDVCVDMLKGKVIEARKDLVGVVFFNSKVQANENAFPGICVFRPLEEPGAEMIKDVASLADPSEFRERIGVADQPVDFSKVLWVVQTLFGDRKLSKHSKRAFVFTARDNPVSGEEGALARAVQKVEDLEDLNVELELFPLSRNFDHTAFFMHVISIPGDEDVSRLQSVFSSQLEELRTQVRKREYKKRALASIPLTVAPDVVIGVKLYCMLRRQVKNSAINLDHRTNDRLTCLTRWICAETAQALEPHEIKTYHTYGGEKVFFTKEEMSQIKDFGPPSMKLLGFKSVSKLRYEHNFKNSYFMYPDEGQVEGSTTAFFAIHSAMVSENKMAIVRMTSRRGSAPQFVALLPQEEVLHEDGLQAEPPGMHVIFLPYADDLREVDIPRAPIAPPAMVLEAKVAMKKMLLSGVEPSKFHNPELQKHYKVLQALALDEEVAEDAEDELMPHPAMLRRAKPYIDAFANSEFIPAEANEPPAPKRGRKRKADDGGGSSSSRAAKRVQLDPSEFDWESRIQGNTLNKLKNDELKSYLRQHQLRLGGRKAELIERIKEHWASTHN